jgi:hypothetical protein
MRALMFLVLASCTHDLAVYDRVTVRPARDLDILYVLDDSWDRGKYDQMASQLDVLQQRLRDVDGQLPNLHVGVVTTDLGTRGTKDALARPPVAQCAGDGNAGRLVSFRNGALAPTGAFIEDLRDPGGARIRNYDSDNLTFEVGRLTNPAAGVADSGCEFEQPLEAMRRALDPAVNPDFIRPGAMLSVVFLTTEDDCSFSTGALLDAADGSLGPLSSFRCTEQGVICDGDEDPRRPGVRTNCRPREGSPFLIDVAEYRSFLEQYKPNPRDVVVSAVAGPRDPFEVREIGVPTLLPSCQGAGGNVRPAVRIGSLVDSFGGALVDGCTQESAYEQIAAPIVSRQRSCLPNLRQDDGEDCSVVEIVGGARTELARCADGTASPCWYTYTDATACPDGDNLGIAIRRDTAGPANARVEATCFAK